jgi:hypothetical protein
MRLSRVTWLVFSAAVLAGPAVAQAQACLHTGLESPAEIRRRDDALAAARLINNAMRHAVRRLPNQRAEYQTWEELGASPAIATLRGMGGPMGELARRIQWGSSEPLPGWRIRHVTGGNAYAFSLTDTRDPCSFTYSSDETGTIVEGYPVDDGRRGGIMPVT